MEKRKRLNLFFYLILFFFFLISFLLNNKINIVMQPLLWLILSGVLSYYFPPIKERNRYFSNHLKIMITSLLLFYFIYYLSGFFIGFKNNFIVNNYFIYLFIVPLLIFMQEYVRGKLLFKQDKQSRTILCLLFVLITTSMNYSFYFDVNYNLLLFLFIINISKNVLCNYLTYEISYKLSFIYRFMIECLIFIIPISPKIPIILELLFQIFLPIIILDQLYRFSPLKHRFRNKKQIILYPIGMVIIVFVCLVSGIFRYQMIAVASNSMIPVFQRGDAIIFDKNVTSINKGDILVFYRDDNIIIHRVEKIVKEKKEEFYQTKGDNNPKSDYELVEQTDVIGIVKTKIPWIGYPSIWIKELR